MMADVATHVRIFEGAPGDDFVTKRIAVAEELSGKFLQDKNANTLLSIADGIAQACLPNRSLPPELISLVEAAIRAQSTSFIRAGNELQLLTMALLGLDRAISVSVPSSSLSIGDVIATGVWLSFSFQPVSKDPKLEALRTEVMLAAQTLSFASASRGRERLPIEEINLEPSGSDLSEITVQITTATNAPISILRENAILDREELDFLWWALSDYSPSLKLRLSSLPPATAAIAAGFDAAQLLRRLPAHGHQHVVLRHVRERNSLSLHDLITEIGPDSKALSVSASNQYVQKFPAIFGLLAALNGHASAPTGSGRAESLGDWASRALLEAGFLRILALLPGAEV